MDLLKCNTVEIKDAERLRAIALLRTTSSFRFVPVPGAPAQSRELPDPSAVFRIAFGRDLPPAISERVTRLFAREWRTAKESQRFDSPGYIYCFHDLADPPNVLKIGRTERRPEKRRAEWERELAPGQGKSVIILFAYRTDCNEFAEAIVHEALRCARIHNRINPLTRNELTEFFELDNVLAASIFVRETLRYVNRFCGELTARFGSPERGKRL